MPIYEYACNKCGKTIEVIQKFSDPALRKHKECGGVLTKLISASGFQFKGTGWYVTDYAKKGGPASEAKDAAPKSDSSSTEPSTPAAAKTKSESSKKSSDSKD
jgi:putative FmdB family regulatory protein